VSVSVKSGATRTSVLVVLREVHIMVATIAMTTPTATHHSSQLRRRRRSAAAALAASVTRRCCRRWSFVSFPVWCGWVRVLMSVPYG
jgi:hypothetical protein